MSNSFGRIGREYNIYSHFLVILSLLISTIISGCIQKALDFETIDQGQISGYHEKDPNFFVVSDNNTWKTLYDSYFQGQMFDINFNEYIIILAFQGEKNTGGYNISIDKISQIGSIVNIVVVFTEPKRGEIVAQVFTQPYLIIKIKKNQIKGAIFRFLDAKGNEIKRVNLI